MPVWDRTTKQTRRGHAGPGVASVASAAENDRLLYLDGIRGLASLCIAVLFHYAHFSGMFQPGAPPRDTAPFFNLPIIHQIYTTGDVAVDVFFLLSGIVFSKVYGDDIVAGKVSARVFFVRRFARLYPIHVATLLVSAVLIYVFFHFNGRFPVYKYNGPIEFLLNLLFIQNGTLERDLSFNGPAWSLSIEAMVYVVFFIVASRGMRLHWVIFLIFCGLVSLFTGSEHNWRPMLHSGNIGRGLIGFFLGLAIHRFGERRPIIIGLCVLVLGGTTTVLSQSGAYYARAWMIFGLCLLVLQEVPSLRRPLELPVFRELGDISLAIYLLHFPIQVAMLLVIQAAGIAIPYGSFAFLGSYIVLVIGLARVVHYRFELPMQRYIRRRFGH